MRTISILLYINAASLLSPGLLAQEAKPAATNQATPRFQQRLQNVVARPTQGKLLAIDKTAMTITVGPEGTGDASPTAKIVLLVSTNAIIVKNGKRATLDEGIIGEPVRYYAKKAENGKEVAAWIMFGLPPATRQPQPVEKR